jgi:hypothetical protein
MNKNRLHSLTEFFLVLIFFIGLSVAITWPIFIHMDSIVVGGGELGGWLWRQWWHFEEVKALEKVDLGFFGWVEALIGLGRFPETGNILDLLLLSFPLREWFGSPMDHNLKTLIILVGNGLCGYALARSYTDSKLVALAAASVAIINPLVIQDINKTGLRQVTLWWLLLFPIFLQRAGRTGNILDGILSGLCFALIAAFYWFYGLFAGLFGLFWVLWWAWKERPPWRHALRWLSAAAVTSLLGVFFFLMPYFSAGQDDQGQGGTEKLPELTFFLAYPAYDTVASAPQRPSSYRENVLSSLHRGIDSSWPADYIIDPRHGVLAFPLAVFLAGIIPAFFLRRARMWFLVWLFFWLGTLGPFLKLGAQQDTSEVFRIGEYVIRMPYVLMFQFIPGMSRMFAPYRLASMVVVSAVALVSIGLDSVRIDIRKYVATLTLIAIILQPFYRFDLGPVEYEARPAMWRIPTQISSMKVPDWYKSIDPDGWEGIIELPLEQQQDLLCAYQSIHRQKVYRSWATMPAVPPWIRNSGGGIEGRRMRWLANPEPRGDTVEPLFRKLSRDPLTAPIDQLQKDGLIRLMDSSDYRWLIIHERGYYLLDPNKGDTLYRDVVRKFKEQLGIDVTEVIEQQAFEWPGKRRHFPVGPAWVPWASQEVQKPSQDMPDRYFMAIFDLYEWKALDEQQ